MGAWTEADDRHAAKRLERRTASLIQLILTLFSSSCSRRRLQYLYFIVYSVMAGQEGPIEIRADGRWATLNELPDALVRLFIFLSSEFFPESQKYKFNIYYRCALRLEIMGTVCSRDYTFSVAHLT